MQPVQINIYQSNTYKKGFSWSHLGHEPRVQERQQVFDQHSYNHVSAVYLIYPNRSQEQQPSDCNSVPSKAVCQIYSDKEQHQDKETLQNESMHLFSCRQFQQQNPNPNQTRKIVPASQKMFFLKSRPIHVHINSTSVVRPIKQNKLSFSSIEINKLFPSPVRNVSQVRSKFRSQFQLLPQIKCLISLRVEEGIIGVDSNIRDNIVRTVINVLQEKLRAKEGTLRNMNINWIFLSRLSSKSDLKPSIYY